MEVASGDYGDHVARLVKAVNEGKCEKNYRIEMNGEVALNSFLWHKSSDEVQTQTVLCSQKKSDKRFLKWKEINA